MKLSPIKSIKSLLRFWGQKSSFLFSRSFAVPIDIFLVVTEKCNFRCSHCDIWKLPRKNELSAIEWKEITRQLITWMKFGNITISGGEPLLKKEILDIIDSFQNTDFFVTLNTNGFLVDKKLAQKLVKSNLNEIKISLYSLNQKNHDEMRRMTGSWNKSVKAIEYLLEEKNIRKKELKISLAVLITNKNIFELPKIIQWAKKKNIEVVFQSLDENLENQQIGKYRNNWWQKSDLWPKDQNVIQASFDKIIELKKLGYPIANSQGLLQSMKNFYLNPSKIANNPCYVGQKNLVISPDGRVRFCFRGSFLGNLKGESIKKVWNNTLARHERKIIKKCPKTCRIVNCNYPISFRDKFKSFFRRLNNAK